MCHDIAIILEFQYLFKAFCAILNDSEYICTCRLELNGAGKAPRGPRSDIFEIHIFSWKLKKISERIKESGKKIRFPRN